MICFTDHPTIVPNAQFPMPKAIIIESERDRDGPRDEGINWRRTGDRDGPARRGNDLGRFHRVL